MIRTVLFLLVGSALICPISRADVPIPCCDSSLDATMRLLLIPDENGTDPHPAADFWVIVRNSDCIPIQGAIVEVLVGGVVAGKVRLCSGAQTIGTTDENGYVEFNIPGGGCFRSTGAAVVIRANGVEIRNYPLIMSPDYAGWDNDGVAGRASLSVDPIDLAAFVTAYQGGNGPPSCHDYTNDGAVDPVDLSTFVSAWSGGMRDCSP